MQIKNRRQFIKAALLGTTAVAGANRLVCADELKQPAAMRFGLVTYLWGKDMNLPTLIETCEKSQLGGVELRTQHAHGVEPDLSKQARDEVRKRFADSSVELVGYGSNAQFHDRDPAELKRNIELTKKYVQLMHDCGGSGVKVKPNGFPNGVDREQTIEQIGKSLNEVAKYAHDFGQQIRVEVHGRGTSELPVMRDIFEVADHPNATICWNSNDADLDGEGLEHNFHLVQHRFGATVHVRELDQGNYPYPDLMRLLTKIQYKGWILLEARTNPSDKIAALIEQRRIFDELTK